MQPEHEFEAILEADPADDGGVWLVVPAAISAAYGKRGRVPIRATFDGFPYRGSLSPLGNGAHGLLVLKQIRKAIGKSIGDTVRVALARDQEERIVAVPDDLAAALAEMPTAATYFAKLAFSHRREYVRWLEDAKKPETRAHRLTQTIEMLAQGKRR